MCAEIFYMTRIHDGNVQWKMKFLVEILIVKLIAIYQPTRAADIMIFGRIRIDFSSLEPTTNS